ncbi:MAG: asparagine synthase (glutamine-hydrolyzing) [bacterium]|nr:asparagine synthase (glutamine-hydrolyzing) [bacterium]
MCSISGFINFKDNYLKTSPERCHAVASDMAYIQRHRGPDAQGVWLGEHAAFSHRRLAVIDIEGGRQPMKRTEQGYDFIITYNGELYNAPELKKKLEGFGYTFMTASDTEIVLYTYIHYGKACADYLNGIYAFAVYDTMRQRVFLCRDRFGVKPLFYTSAPDGAIVFASEIKALFKYPGVTPKLDRSGLCELFAISPARTQGCGVFKDIYELCPGEFMTVGRLGILKKKYYSLKSMAHTDSYGDTIEHVRSLVIDAVKRQLVSDVPIGTLLSGGLDSSIITAIAANEFKKDGRQLDTYSFDYEGNDKYFHPSSFQPDSDTQWVPKMSGAFNTNHTYLSCPNSVLTELLDEAALVKDLPGMADCDSSLLYFCREIKKNHTVILSGECSDEIFGGYPWFRDERAFVSRSFPWCYDLSMREYILKDKVRDTLNIGSYSRERYEELVSDAPRFDGDTNEEARRREIAYLNIMQFMTNLLDRKDRMSMASGLEVRVPFCDHRLVEYVWNIPWEMKNKNNVSKNVLREAAKGILPEDVRLRKKSPYPKTHNPIYESDVKKKLSAIADDSNSPLLALCERSRIREIANGIFDYGKPFFGQLMAGPQFIGFLVQLNTILKHYNPRIV